MRKKVQALIIFALIITSDVVFGVSNKSKSVKTSRIKRSINDENDKKLLSNIRKRQIDDDPSDTPNNNGLDFSNKVIKSNDKVVKDEPFWANRGRRDSSENYDYEYPEYFSNYCKNCDLLEKLNYHKDKDRREDFMAPFWGSRGRRNSLEDSSEPFWGNRGRRYEKEEPFWGNRGRRGDDEPFWGNRGRREDEPFWGNRGRREDIDPFWGNRGRRQDSEPFWGNRGRRQENEPFWGNRGRRRDTEPWLRSRKEDLKNSILSAINDVETDIENLSRLKRPDSNSFWANRGRDNKMSMLFNGASKYRGFTPKPMNMRGFKKEPGTVLDNRMYVDEPNYILVERTGRSSSEMEDPYYISRGKKYYLKHNLNKVARDRRGAIEEIVKSVRNDPYYIARGKKDIDLQKINSIHEEEYMKGKDLICAAIDLIMVKNNSGKVKRQPSDNERDRRTTLKKLAAQLQADPYFVSRGKKSENDEDDNHLQQFISNIAEKCD